MASVLHYVAASLCLTCHLSKIIPQHQCLAKGDIFISAQCYSLVDVVTVIVKDRTCSSSPPHMCNTAKPLFLLRAVVSVVTLSVSLSKTQRSIELFCDNLVVSLYTFNSRASTT